MLTSVFAKLGFLGAAFGKRLESSHAKNDNAFVASQEASTASLVFSKGAVAKKSSAKLTPITSVFLAMIFASPLQIAYAQNNSRALPTGGNVVAGNATITQSNLQMNINQTSQRAVVNWESFNVGKDATVNFNQPNASAVTLNRVTGANASVIDGAVRANGQVILVNPNGVTFGRGAQVDAAGVVASTLNISNKDFMDGKSTYTGGSTGAVVNQGKITANSKDGYIALLAPEVRNEGYLLANKGPGNAVAMASGEKITLDFRGDQLISVKVDQATYRGLLENKRLIEVPGGLIVVAAGSAGRLMATTINNTGVVSASSVVDRGGVVEFVASSINQAGAVAASGKGVISNGGAITMVGDNINLASGSKTVATGGANGGVINIGTSAVSYTQNVNGLRSNVVAKDLANTTTIADNALVDASSTSLGNGGQINIWSSVKTSVAGSLKALGGVLGGDGGFIETSSKTELVIAPSASIDTSAPKGRVGQWLLDPIDLTVDADLARVISLALSYNNVTVEVNANTNACPSIGACTQNGSGSLTIASGADILKQGNAFTSLTLSASGMFTLNANIVGQNLNVIINSSIAYLNVGTTIEATQVTVQAQSIYANGTINGNGSNTLGGAIQLLAQAIYISGRLNVSASTNSTSSTTSITVTYVGTVLRQEDLPTFLAAQNNLNTVSNTLDTVYSSSAANDANYVPLKNTATNVITLNAAREMTLYSTAEIKANGTTGMTDGAAGAIYLTAPSLNAESGSLIQANGNNGPGGAIAANGSDIHLAGTIQANGSSGSNRGAGGSFAVTANTLTIDNAAVVQTNGQSGPGGTVTLNSTQDIQVNQALISANGDSDGGSITIVSNAGNLNIQNALIQTNGSTGRGGSIGIAAFNQTILADTTVEATGLNQGGTILIGNDARNGTLPFSIYTDINSGSVISSRAKNADGVGGFIETSGHALNLLGVINAGQDGLWLIDPYNITITSSADANVSNSSYTYTPNNTPSNLNVATIQAALNAGTSVTIQTGASGNSAGDILILSAISKTAGSDATLTLTAANDITVYQTIVSTVGKLNINFNANSAAGTGNGTTLYAGLTSNGGAITFGTSASNGNVAVGGNITINSGGGLVTINGSLQGIAQLLYETTNPTRDGAGNIIYTSGYGVGGSDAAAVFGSNAISRITYRMEVNVGGTLYYADVSFDAWSGATATGATANSLRIPDISNTSVLQKTVYNMIVKSNQTSGVSGKASAVSTGSGKTGLLELWYWNYDPAGGNSTLYDYADSPSYNGNYGSFQVHNQSTGATILAWNQHAAINPDIGIGSYIGTAPDGSRHPDWTFSAANSLGKADWKLQIAVNESSSKLTLNSGAGAVDIKGATSNLAALTINAGAASSISGVISGPTALTKQGAGILTLSAQNTYTGTTTVSAGTLKLAPASNFTVNLTGAFINNAAIIYDGSNGGVTFLSGGASGAGTWEVTGSTAPTNIHASRISISGTVTTSGQITVSNYGNLWIEGTGINATSSIYLNGVNTNLYLYGPAATTHKVGTLTGTGTIDFANGGGGQSLNLSIGNDNGTGTFRGVIKNSGAFTGPTTLGLIKAGTGAQTLSGANTYSGGTTVSGGSLVVGISSTGAVTNGAFGTGIVTIQSGYTLDLNGFSVANALNLSGGGLSSNGALINSNATAATASGAVTIASATSIGGTGAMTISGAIAASTNTVSFVNGANVTATNTANNIATIAITGSAVTLKTISALTVNASSLSGATTLQTVAADKDITVSGAITSNVNANTLTLMASRDIIVSAAISGVAGKSLSTNFYANTDNAGAGGYKLTAAISTYGGNLYIGGGTNDLTSGCAASYSCTSGYANSNTNAVGVWVSTGGSINAGGGNIAIYGMGNTTSSTNGDGVQIYSSGDVLVTSGAGTISISGIATGGYNAVRIVNSNIIAGTGLISITGTTNSASSYDGVRLEQVTSGTMSINSSGALTINGIGGSAHYGVEIYGAGSISVAGDISITGQNANRNYGVYINDNRVIQTSAGNISVTAEGTAGMYLYGSLVAGNSLTAPTSGGTISIVATGNSAKGLEINSGSLISYGAISVTSTASANHAFYLHGTGAKVLSSSGITVNATAGNWGLTMYDNSFIQATGGNISITSNGSGGGLYMGTTGGIYASSNTASPTATPTAGGTLTINATGTSQYGIQMSSGSLVSNGAMSITASGAGVYQGMYVYGAGTFKAVGDITINTTNTGATWALYLDSSRILQSTAGNISITASGGYGVYINGGGIVAGNDITTPISGGTITINSASSANDISGAALRIDADGTKIIAYGDITIYANGTALGLNTANQQGHGVILYGSSQVIRSYRGNLTITGYANHADASVNGWGASISGGITLWSGSDILRAYGNVTLKGVSMGGIGMFLTYAAGTGGGVTADTGNVAIDGLSNSGYAATYIRLPVTATLGSVFISGAGNGTGGIYQDAWYGSVSAKTDISMIGYSTGAYGIYYGIGSVTSTNGSVTLSGYSSSANTGYYGIYSNGINTSAVNGSITFQGAKINSASSGGGYLVNAASMMSGGTPNIPTPLFAVTDSASSTYGATNGLYWTGNITANITTGQINLYAKAPYISGIMTAYGLFLGTANQSYSLSGSNAVISVLAGSIGTGSLTLQTASNLEIGSLSGIDGFTGSGLSITETATLSQTKPINVSSLSLTGTNGVFNLDQANTVSTSITVNSGTLKVSNASALGAASTPVTMAATSILLSNVSTLALGNPITMSGAATINAPSAYTLTLSGILSGSGNLTINSPTTNTGTVIFTGANTYTGTTTISAGTLQIGSGSTTGVLGAGAVTNNAALIFNRSNDFTVASKITGTGSMTKEGSGALTLTSNNTFSGGTTVNAGILILSDSYGIPGDGVLSGTLTVNANGVVQLKNNPGAFGWNTRVSTLNINGGLVEAIGSGPQHIWNATVNFNGGGTLRINGGTSDAAATAYWEWGYVTVNVTNPTAVAEIAGRIRIRGETTATTFTVADGVVANDLLLSAAITEVNTPAGTFSKAGAGTMTLSGANNFTGAVTVNAGTLAVSNSTGLGTSAGGVTVANGATLDLQNIAVGAEATTLNGGALLVSTGTSSLGGTVALGANSAVNVAGTQLTISGAISGANGYTKSGVGDLILTATNTYTGATTISAGTLIFQNDAPSLTSSSFTGPGSLIVKPNGTSFTNAYTFDESLSTVTKLSALTLGKSGNAANITVSSAANVAGPITVYGGNIVISNVLNTTGATGSSGLVSLYASDSIKVSSNITTTGAAVLISSNTDGLNGGAINLNASTISTGGGSITLGGGSDGSGYAEGSASSIQDSFYRGMWISGSTLNAAGGNIALRGKGWQGATFGSNTYNYSIGIDLVVGTSIYTSGTGDITLNGVGGINYSPANHSVGINFYLTNSIYTASGNVLLTATAGTGTARTNAAINNDGGVTSIYSTAGNVTLNGNGASADKGINVVSGATLYIGYNSADTVNTSGNILLQANSLNVTGVLNLKNAGLLTIEPIATSFTSAFTWPIANINILSTGGLTLGKSGNASDMTIGSAVTIAGPIKIYGGNIAINAALTASGTNTIWLYGSGNVTDGASGYLVADKLALIGGAVTLNSASNNVGTIAGESLTSLTYVDSNALTIGVVNPTGITATGLIDISTVSGNLTVSENITTSSTANNAIVLNASSATAAGTSTGGNILISNTTAGVTPILTTGSGGRVTLYTGGVSGSAGLTDLIGTGTGRFRYYSDETSTNYNTSTAALSTGMYAIYRERPAATIAADSKSITYGDTLTLTGTTSGLVNGDTGTYSLSSPTYSTSNNIKVGTYTIVGSGPIALGYNVAATNGTLTVGQKAVTIGGFTVSDKAYDGTIAATVSNAGTVSGKVAGDVVTVASITAAFTNKNAGLQNLIISGGTLSGTDAANYTSSISGSTTATINPKVVTLTAPIISKTYNSNSLYTTQAANLTSLSTQLGVSGDTVTAATLAFANKDAGAANKTVSISGAVISDGNSGNNYTITYASNSGSTITPAALTVTGANTTATYSGLAQTNSAATVTGLQGSDNFTITGYGAGTNYRATAYADTLVATPVAGTLASNYTISYTNGGISIGKAALVVTADNQTRIYGNANPTLTYTVTGYVNGEGASVLTGAPSISTTATNTSNVGNVTITAAANTLAASNYSLSYANGTLSITPAALSITGANATATYTGLAQTNSAASVSGLKNTDSFTISGYGVGTNASTTAYADTLVATPVAGTLASNYTISYTNGGITIGKANATVTGNSASVTYTGLAQSVSGYTATGLVNNETIAVLTGVSASGATGINAASYTNTMSGTDSNYNLTLVNGTLTIGKANATVTGNSANVTYNANSQSVSGYNATGLVNGETIAVLTGVTASGATGTNYGSYTNTVSGTDSNYNLTLVNGTLAIAKAALTVTGANTTATYSGLAQTNSAATVTGLQGSDNFTITGYGAGTNYRATAYADTLVATPVAGTLASNYTISYTNGGISIGKAALVVTADNQTRIYGNANPTLTYTVTGYVNGEGASVLTGAPSISTTATNTSNVGNVTITAAANTLAASNYSLSYANGTLSITPAALSITGANATATYTGLAQTNSAASVSGLKNTDSFTISGYGVGTNASTTAYADTLVATPVAGTLASNYTISYTNGGITIGKANATVTGNSASVTYTGLAQSVSGYTATGLVNNETIAVLTGVSASGATGINAASYTNTMSGTDSNYNLTLVNGTLTIGKANATVTGNSANVTYNANSQSVSGYNATGLVNGETIAVLTGVTASGATGTNYGSYTNTVSGTDSNYNLTLVNGTLAIAKAALTVTGANTTATYSGLAQTNSAATVTGLQGSDNFTITGYGAGTNYRATAYADTLVATPVAGTLASNYTISYTNGGISIGKAALVVTADNQTRIYGNANPTLTYTVTGYVNGEGASVLTGAPSISTTATNTSNVGNVTITAAANTLAASNYSLSYANGTLSITPAALSITGANATATYTGLAQTNSAASVSGLKNTDSFTISGYGVGTNASTTAYADTLVATPVAGTLASNYTISYTNGGITIGKANATVTGNSASVTYTGLAQSVSGYTATGLVNNETIAVLTGVSASGATGINAASYTNTMSGTDSNYNLTLVNGTLTIGKANATVTGNSANVTYNANSQSVSGYNATGLVNGETIAVLTGVTASGATGTNYGSYTNTVSGTDSNYNLTLVNGTLAIAKAALTVTGANTTATYSGLAQTNSAATVTGLQGSDNFTITGYGAGTNYRATAYADTLVATPVAGTLASNYTISYTNGGISIGKAALVVTADNQTRIYGNANPTLTYTVTGYVNGEGASVLTGAPSISTTATNTSNVGNVTITAAANTLAASNYSLSYANGTLSITARPITITANAGQNKIYGNTDPVLTYTIEANSTNRGLVNGDSFTGALTRANGENVGVYAISQGNVANSNYAISYVADTLAITARPIALTANSGQTKIYGNADPVLTYTIEANGTNRGLVGSDSFTGALSRVTGENVGNYAITQGTVANSNYAITYVADMLAVTPKNLTVINSVVTTKTYDASNLASITGGTLVGVVAGDAITLSQSGIFASVNAASGIAVTANNSISGNNVGNYTLTQPTGLTGTINRLGSVTYVGPSGGNWSLASNWTNGALPIGNNVATVYIPSGVMVKYDSAIVDPVQSTINNLGILQFTNSAATNFIASVVGSGTINQSGVGTLTIGGNNALMTGNTFLSNGSSMILANTNALGSGKVISSNGSLGVQSGIRLPNLNVEGPIRLTSNVTTLGQQNYAGPVLLSVGDVSLTTTNADISFGSTINAEGANRSLTLNAGSGQVSFNGKVGDIAYTYGDYLTSGKGANISVLDVAAGKIFINADIQTVDAQIYRGPVIIGDNGSNGRVRNLLSVDPSITFMSTVDDALANTHTLQAAAVSFNSATPSVFFGAAVGSVAPLFAMDVVVGLQDMTLLSKVGTINTDPANYLGDITISGDVSTMNNQTYTASRIALGGNQGTGILNFTSTQGQITFNTRGSAPGGFVIKDGALLTEVNLNVLNDNSVVGFSGLPAGINGRLNKPMTQGAFAKMESNNVVGALHATLVANNNFQLANTGVQSGGVTVSSPQDVALCVSEENTQSCTRQ